ncbi:MAG: MBL fold metallo-hydrolase [Myxococcales bacterium]|nr:MBL fold metallo-hydrolase [Myxococcales bacterium]
MELRRIETPGISHYAYLLADDGGEAIVIDPRRDVDEYLSAARAMGVRIRYIVETHRQEDFVMGSAHLAERTGAQIVNGVHDLFGHGDVRLSDSEMLELKGLRLQALHTPGHTPESMCYAVYTEQGGDAAWGVFTGDTLFFGETGRTDLADPDRAEQHAGALYDAVHQKLGGLADTAQVLPAHGPGSVCGSGMVALSSSTLGAERRYNPVFVSSRDEFARRKGAERLPRPPYFRHLERINLKGGVAPKGHPDAVALLDTDAFAAAMSDGICIDTREPEAYAGGHVRDAYSIWLGGLPVFGGWVAEHDTPIYVVGDRTEDAATSYLHLSRIGIDGLSGALAGGFGAWRRSGRPILSSGVTTPHELAERLSEVQILDVRDADEFASGHIPQARNVYVGHLEAQLAELELDRERPVVVTCGVGHRAGLGVSILRRAGFQEVSNLLGGMSAWQALRLRLD